MLYRKIEKLLYNKIYKRSDKKGYVFYFTAKDFEGLCCESFAFPSSAGHTLQGYFYYYEKPIDGRIVIFDHGMGSGHTGYMKEIELLARRGYLVFSYDHTGCMESGGEGTGGFSGSTRDLDDAIRALRGEERFKGFSISVVGHSWGGCSTLNIGAYHPDLTHLVAISGFISTRAIIDQFFGGILAIYRNKAYKKELENNPVHAKGDAISALKNTSAKVLVIHSQDDLQVNFKRHYKALEKEFSKDVRFTFLPLDGKGHNPNYTEDAVKYKDEFFASLVKHLKAGELEDEAAQQRFVESFDFNRMTAQDESVWEKIFAHLEA